MMMWWGEQMPERPLWFIRRTWVRTDGTAVDTIVYPFQDEAEAMNFLAMISAELWLAGVRAPWFEASAD